MMKDLISKLISGFILVFITVLTVMYSEGWRINPSTTNSEGVKNTLVKTGMLAVRSIPEGAKVYINDELITATDDTISALKPEKYKLKLIREGFEPWVKEVEVYPELVTDITAVLILQSPRLEPLTGSDVKAFNISNNQNSIAFTTKNQSNPGIWLLPLSQTGMNLFRNEAYSLVQDTALQAPSLADQLTWSPDDTEILVKMNEKGYLLYTLTGTNKPTEATTIADPSEVQSRWNEYWKTNFLQEITPTLTEQKIPQNLFAKLNDTYGKWSPDNKKFYTIEQSENEPKTSSLVVYNSEIPIPVGEKRLYTTLNNIDPINTKIYWYSDSYHLILVEKVIDRQDYYIVSLIRIDGTNKTTIYTGNLASNEAYSTPGGDKIIVLTSLKENTPNNLYSISIR